MKNALKIENILIFGGLAVLAIWIFKKRSPRIIDVPDNNINNTEPKTIVLNLNQTQGKTPVLQSNVRKDYNSSKFATVAPAMVTINEKGNFYDI